MANYPTSLDDATTLPEPSAGATIPAAADTNRSEAIKELEAKVGIGTAPATGAADGEVLTADGAGSSDWEAIPAPEGTAVLSTGEAGGSKFLREDGDGTSSWQAIPGGGDLLAANNLSDIGNAATALSNLGGEPEKGADDNFVTDAEKVVIGNTSGTNTGDEAAASTTTAGVVEIATAAETTTGTDTTRAVSPDGLAGSEFGERSVQAIIFDWATDTATGDGKFYFHIDSRLAGMNLVDVHAEVITAGTTGTTDIQIHNLTQTSDMLSTKLTIDSGETGSDTAATPAVIDTANDDVAENDVLRIDVDAVSTTAAQGLIVTMGFRTP